MPKPPLILIKMICIFGMQVITAQSYQYHYYFDKTFNLVSKDNAIIIAHAKQVENNVQTDFFLLPMNQLIANISFTDSSLKIKNGPESIFYDNGKIQQMNFYQNNVLDGSSRKWDKEGRLTDSVIYVHGATVYTNRSSYAINSPYKMWAQIEDKRDKTLNEIYFDSAGRVSSEVFFTGDKGVLKIYNTDGSVKKTEDLFTRGDKEASFPGGLQGWQNYLERNLNGSVPVRNGAYPRTYTVIVQFIIDAEGKIYDVKPLTHYGYGMEDEAVRVISSSPRWEPALHFGRPVKSYRKQPVAFAVVDKRNMN